MDLRALKVNCLFSNAACCCTALNEEGKMKIGNFLTIFFIHCFYARMRKRRGWKREMFCDALKLKLHDSIIGSIILLNDVNELEQVIAIISLFYYFAIVFHVILESESSRLNANMETLFAKEKRATTQTRWNVHRC